MKITEKQVLMLFALLQSSLEKDIEGYLIYNFEQRVALLKVIVKQQSDKAKDIKDE